MSTTKSRSLPTSYTWSFTGSPIQIPIRLSVIADLQRLLRRDALPDSKSPLCGFLLGAASHPGVTEITGFEPLPTLRPDAVEKIRHRNSGIIGFYRTTEKGSLTMSDQDMALAHAHFTDPASVVLLIEAAQTGPSNAVFFFWEQGKMHGDLALMEFPFDADQLALTEQRRTKTLERPRLVPERVDRGEVARKSSSQPTARLAAAGLVVVGLGAGSWYFARGRNASAAPPAQKAVEPTPAAPSLGLALDRHGANLQLYWNNQAQPILNGRFGMVLIREGDKSRTIALNQDQLRSGSILYEPTTDEVEMELNVIAGDRVTRESITAVLPLAGAAHPVISSAQIVQPVRQRVASRDEPESATNEPVQRELRKFSVPAASKTTARAAAPSLTEPPLVATAAGTGNPTSLPAWSPFPLPPLPSSPSSSPRLPDPSTPASTAKSRKSAAPDPPVAIHQVVPRFPTEMRPILIKPTSVEILVKIDIHGKVVNAQPTAAQTVNALLIQAALDAARSWTFRPAAIAGTPVPGEMILTFNFTPTR